MTLVESKRPRLRGVKFVVVLLYLAGIGLLFGHGMPIKNNVDIPITESFIQSETDAHLPKEFHGIVVDKVTFTLHDKVDILAEMHGNRLLRKFTMVIHTTGQPDYSLSKQGKIFYKPQTVEVAEFQFNGTPPGELLTKIRDRYTKPNGMMNKVLADVAPKVDGWIQEAAEKTAVLALQHIPIYDLNKHWYGYYFGGALKNITVQGDTMVASLSITGIIGVALIAIVVLLLAIGLTVMFFACPEALLFFAVFG